MLPSSGSSPRLIAGPRSARRGGRGLRPAPAGRRDAEALRPRFVPDIAGESFTGTARIEVDVEAPRPSIVLNALELAISDARISQAGRTGQASVVLDAEKQQATLTPASPLSPGPADRPGVLGSGSTGSSPALPGHDAGSGSTP